MRFGLRPVWVFLLGLALIGCGQPRQDAPQVERRDSAGIEIVETLILPTDTAPWRLSAEPLFEVGWDEEDPTFQNLRVGVVLGGNLFVVGEGDGSGIYYLDEGGRVVRQVGREGEGPGEYRNITAIIGLRGDSLLVQDDSNMRSTVLDENGDWAGDLPTNPYEGRLMLRGIGVTPRQELLLWPYAYSPSGFSSPGWIEGPLVRLSSDGSTADTVFQEGFAEHPGPGVSNPFLNYGMAGMGGGKVVYARTDRPEVSWVDEEGEIQQIARWEPEWRPVDESVWAEYEEVYLSRFTEGEERDRIRTSLRERDRADPEALPLFGRAFVDHEGNAWLGEYRVLGGLPDRYRVVVRDGTILGWVFVPPGLRILDISEDRILGVRTNEWDVQAAVAYGLEKE